MLAIRDVACEADFRLMCALESGICRETAGRRWPVHVGGLCFDRYLFGGGGADVYVYGKLLIWAEEPVGYALVYADEGLLTVRLLSAWEGLYGGALSLLEAAFAERGRCAVVANDTDRALCGALTARGFTRGEEERFQAALDLTRYTPSPVTWESERPVPLTAADVPERAQYAAIPTGADITAAMYAALMASEVYRRYARDYVIRSRDTGALAGFVTWWVDADSGTALLEPVACLPAFRRRGIMKRALLAGLNGLKREGVRWVYVSTSIHNAASQPLYRAVGFEKLGTACRYTKSL